MTASSRGRDRMRAVFTIYLVGIAVGLMYFIVVGLIHR
jgi:hypothetical protein